VRLIYPTDVVLSYWCTKHTLPI